MLLDVADIILAAFDKLKARYPGEAFELVVSTAPAKNLEAMEALFSEAGFEDGRLRFATDAGASFDERHNDAFAQCFAASTDLIFSMGADMPALTEDDVIRGFDALHELRSAERGGVVLAPDQEMGVSIIGWTRETDFDHTGVFYNPHGLGIRHNAQLAANAEEVVRHLADGEVVRIVSGKGHNHIEAHDARIFEDLALGAVAPDYGAVVTTCKVFAKGAVVVDGDDLLGAFGKRGHKVVGPRSPAHECHSHCSSPPSRLRSVRR